MRGMGRPVSSLPRLIPPLDVASPAPQNRDLRHSPVPLRNRGSANETRRTALDLAWENTKSRTLNQRQRFGIGQFLHVAAPDLNACPADYPNDLKIALGDKIPSRVRTGARRLRAAARRYGSCVLTDRVSLPAPAAARQQSI